MNGSAGPIALKTPASPSSAERRIHSARSRASIHWTGWERGSGASVGPPRASRVTQYVKRLVGSYGPTITPARTERTRPGSASSAARSHSTLKPP